jgi:hypothetical protein
MSAIRVGGEGEPAGLNHPLTVPAHPRHDLLGPSAADIHGWKTSTQGALIIATGRGLTDSPLYKD